MATVYGADAGFIESDHSAAVAALEQMDSEAAQAVSEPASPSGLVRGNAAAQRQATTQPEKAGRSRKANRLLRKWAANAWVNIDLDTALAKTADPATRERTEAFVRFFDKWYNAGRNGMRSIDVILNADDMEFPPFLQETFYRAGREETGALTKEKYNDFLEKHAAGKTAPLKSFTSTSKRPNGYPLFGDHVVHMVIEITSVTTASDGHPLIIAQEVATHGVETDHGDARPAQGLAGNRREDRGGRPGPGGDGEQSGAVRKSTRNYDGRDGVLSERRKSDQALTTDGKNAQHYVYLYTDHSFGSYQIIGRLTYGPNDAAAARSGAGDAGCIFGGARGRDRGAKRGIYIHLFGR